MVHAYSLVHDDLPAMDDDDLRRGRPTCHKVFGEAVAILVGDALLARAFEVLATEIQPAAVAAKCCAVLGRAAGASALVGGQAEDLANGGRQSTQQLNGTLPELEAIHRRKTGALIRRVAGTGRNRRRCTREQLAALTAYGSECRTGVSNHRRSARRGRQPGGRRQTAGQGRRSRQADFPAVAGLSKQAAERATTLVDEACAMIEVFGPKGEPLEALARFVLYAEEVSAIERSRLFDAPNDMTNANPTDDSFAG